MAIRVPFCSLCSTGTEIGWSGGPAQTRSVDFDAHGLCGKVHRHARPAQLFSRIRRGEAGHFHHVAGPYLLRYEQEASFREDI